MKNKKFCYGPKILNPNRFKHAPSYTSLHMRECIICGELFMTYHHSGRCCFNPQCRASMRKLKICHVCYNAVPHSQFSKKHRHTCKECIREMGRERCKRRRLKQNQLVEVYTREEWQQKVDATNGICPVCNRPYKMGYGLSLDHTPPISKAPSGFCYTIDNVLPMCRSCNSSKSNKLDWDGKTINLNLSK